MDAEGRWRRGEGQEEGVGFLGDNTSENEGDCIKQLRNPSHIRRGARSTTRPVSLRKGKAISKAVNTHIFEPLLDSVQAIESFGGIHPNTKLNEDENRYSRVLDHIEAAATERLQDQRKLAYTKAEAAQLVSLSKRTIDNLIAQKELTVRRIGRRVVVPHTALVALLRSDSYTMTRKA